MRKILHMRFGFSTIEMLFAVVLVTVLSATSYKVLTSQGRGQRESVFAQKQSTQSNQTLDRFRRDAAMIDNNWQQSGIAAIYPHQGLGLDQNFYVNPLSRAEGLNDGVTFLKRNPKGSKFYTLNDTAEYPVNTGSNVLLFDSDLNLVEPTVDLAVNDWVLLFSDKKYVIGVVTSVTQGVGLVGAKVRLRQLNASTEVATIHTNTKVDRASGYVTRAGVIPASFDWNTKNTQSVTDDSIQFQKSKSYLQSVTAVSYELDWATNDGKPAGNGNQHVLNEYGTPKKVVVRTEYLSSGPKREYLSEASQLGITYDALVAKPTATTFSLTGELKGDIATNIGRGANSDVQFANVVSADPDSPSMGDAFISTANITSMKMLLADRRQQNGDKDQKFNEVQVSLALSRSKIDPAGAAGSPEAKNSRNLSKDYATKGGTCFGCNFLENRRLGKPVYVVQSTKGVSAVPMKDPICYTSNPPSTCATNAAPTDNVVGSGDADVAVPAGLFISNFANGGTNVPPVNGELLIFDDKGNSPMADTKCQPSATSTCCKGPDCEKIKFKPKAADNYFAPSTVVSDFRNGTRIMYVGGFGWESKPNSKTITRRPMFASITTSQNMSLREYVAKYNIDPSASGGCSIPSGLCKMVTINSSNLIGSPDRIKDTTRMSVDPVTGHLYLASFTKTNTADKTLSVYKYDPALGKIEEKIVDTTGLGSYRLIADISQNTMTINGSTYLPIATTVSQKPGAPIARDGKIILYNIDNPTSPPIEIANHNGGKVTGMAAVNGNLVVSGSLVTQMISSADISGVMMKASPPVKINTSEVVSYDSNNRPVYANGFYPSKSSYVDKNLQGMNYQQVLINNHGMSVTQIGEDDYAAVMTNEGTIEGGDEGTSYTKRRIADFVTWKLNLGNLGGNRIIASIDTNFEALEQSEVVAVIQEIGSKPNVTLPGAFFANPYFQTPEMRAMAQTMESSIVPYTNPLLTEEAWSDLYCGHTSDPVKYGDFFFFGALDLNVLPDVTTANFPCSTGSNPSTCS